MASPSPGRMQEWVAGSASELKAHLNADWRGHFPRGPDDEFFTDQDARTLYREDLRASSSYRKSNIEQTLQNSPPLLSRGKASDIHAIYNAPIQSQTPRTFTSLSSLGPDTSASDALRMLGGTPPDFPKDTRSFWALMRSGQIAELPKTYRRMIDLDPALDQYLFVSEGSAQLATFLSAYLDEDLPREGQGEEVTGQFLTNLSGRTWTKLRRYGPAWAKSLSVEFQRNTPLKKKDTDASTPKKQLRLDQNLICERLFVGGGEEKQWESELTEAMMNGVTKLDGGFPELFYNHIPVLFFYAAACKTVRRAIVRVKDGKFQWENEPSLEGSQQPIQPVTLDMGIAEHRMLFLLGMVNFFRLLPAINSKGPPQQRRVNLTEYISRPHKTKIWFRLANITVGQASKKSWIACKRIRQYQDFVAHWDLEQGLSAVAYRCVQDKDFAVQTSQPPEITTERKTRKRSQGEDRELTYLLEMTTLGYSRDMISLSRAELQAVVKCFLQTLSLFHASGICHTDIRVENVLWRDLLPFTHDFELVRRTGFKPQRPQAEWKDKTADSDGTLDPSGLYNSESDMHQAGVLLQNWAAETSKALTESGQELCSQLLSKRLTADLALQHSYFQEQYEVEIT